MMKRFILLISFCAILSFPGLARAEDDVDLLLQALLKAPDAERAAGIAAEIRNRWRAQGGPTVTLLFEHADAALEADDLFLARAKFSGITDVQPDFAEGWASRGEFLWQLGERETALSDLETAVDLDPRHFAAHALIGEIREAEGDWDGALAAYRAAHDLYPQWPRPAERVRTLEKLIGSEE